MPGGTRGDHQTEPEGRQSGATRRADRRRYRKTGRGGNPEIGQSAPPKDARFEATRKLHHRQKPEMRTEGKPEASIRGDARGREGNRGNSEAFAKPAARKRKRFGATRRSIAG